jgi:type III restriction enzyme
MRAANATSLKQIAETFRQPEIVKTVRERLDTQMAANIAPAKRRKEIVCSRIIPLRMN